MPAITAEDFKAAKAPAIHQVPVPECGPDAYACIRELGAKDLVALRARHGKEGDTDDRPFVHELLSRTLCSETGEYLFADAAACEDGFGLSFRTLQKLAEEALRLAGIEGKEKNSPPASATS